MSGYNKVILIGNLGGDPEMRFTPSGKPVVNFSLAVNDGKDTEWVRVTAWNKTAELCNQYLEKGKSVCVEGRLQTHKWEDQDGQTKYRTEVIANRVVFLGKKDTQEDAEEATVLEIPEQDQIDLEDIPF